MGEYLSSPKKDKDSIDGQNTQVLLSFLTFTLLYLKINAIVEIWCMRNARLEKDNGGRACDFSRRD